MNDDDEKCLDPYKKGIIRWILCLYTIIENLVDEQNNREMRTSQKINAHRTKKGGKNVRSVLDETIETTTPHLESLGQEFNIKSRE